MAWTATVVVLLVVVAGAGAVVRAKTEPIPPLRVERLLPASVTFPGARPALAWPTQGQAAVEVQGLDAPGVAPLASVGNTKPAPIASVAKIMSAYQVLIDHPLAVGQTGFTVTISAADVADYQARHAQAQSVVAVRTGEVLNEYQLVEALLIPSGNNIATILAAYDAGSEQAFVAKMNGTARTLDMTATTYTDPSGFESTTRSTAPDQLRLAEAAMAIPVFAQIVDMPSVTLPVAGAMANFDSSVGHDGFIGIKTGSDSTAGGCFAFADRQAIDGRTVTILGVILGQSPGRTDTSTLVAASLSAAATLVHSAMASIAVRTVLPAGTPAVAVTDAEGHRVAATTITDLTQLGWGGTNVPLQLTTSPVGPLLAAHQAIATVTVASHASVSTSAVATATLPPVSFRWRLHHLF